MVSGINLKGMFAIIDNLHVIDRVLACVRVENWRLSVLRWGVCQGFVLVCQGFVLVLYWKHWIEFIASCDLHEFWGPLRYQAKGCLPHFHLRSILFNLKYMNTLSR